MPRFYFAIQGPSSIEDLGQVDLPDRAAAHVEALEAARIYRVALSRAKLNPALFAVVVFDWCHQVVEVVSLREE